MKNILIIEDEQAIAETLTEYLQIDGYVITHASNGQKGISALSDRPDCILLDLNLPDMHGFDVLTEITERKMNCGVIVVTGESSMNKAVDAMQRGAHDFVPKPASQERIRVSVANVLERAALKEIVKSYEKVSRDSFQGFIGKSPKMQAIYSILENAAQSKASVFITGESGTGKELAARAVHDLGPRSNKPFEVLNCAAIPHNLLESEIFGHLKGAFTGATEDRKGAASRADGGTLFLDELGEMPTELQAKLLRFTQTGSFMPVGDSRTQEVDVRFICATNRDPVAAIRSGFLREDLYYRLNVIPVHLPPLRERGQDILLLAHHFLEEITREEKKQFKAIDREVENLFMKYRWTGNVRELENTIRRIIVLNQGEKIELSMLNALEQDAGRELDKMIADSGKISSFIPHKPDDIKPLGIYEKEIILAALTACNGNITEASKRLEINPATIHRKQKQWNS